MVKFSMSVFLQLIVCTSAFAQVTLAQPAQQEKWEGYKLVTDVDFQNDAIKNFANNNVLQLVTAGSTNGYTENPTTHEVTYEAFEIVNVDQQPVVNDRSILNKEPRAFQIETCRKQNLKRCPITSVIRSTLFFNQGKYWNCRHSFHNWLYHASKENNRPVNTISPPIKLRQPRKDDPTKFQTVYNSAFPDEALLEMSFIQADERANILYYGNQLQNDSVANITLPYDIIQMVRSQNNILEQDYSLPELPGEFITNLRRKSEVYIMGYAAQTNVFHGQGDAPGDRLVVSHGFIDNTTIRSSSYIFATSNFSSGGESGSPVVSADGTIIGINCGGSNNDDVSAVRSGPMSINTDFLSSLWISYGYPSGNVPIRQASLGGN